MWRLGVLLIGWGLLLWSCTVPRAVAAEGGPQKKPDEGGPAKHEGRPTQDEGGFSKREDGLAKDEGGPPKKDKKKSKKKKKSGDEGGPGKKA